MIEQIITVMYGEQDAKLRNLRKTELASHKIPEQGDTIVVDKKPYTVSKRIFNSDDGDVSVLAVRQEGNIPPSKFKNTSG